MTRSFPEIENYLSRYAGLNPAATPGVISRAVERILSEKELNDPAEFLHLMKSSPKEFDLLLEEVLIPETWFFRYPESYDYLKEWVRAHVLNKNNSPAKLKVLSVPCSSGEEPYSIAISLLDAGLRHEQFHIDAADISQTMLRKARTGRYTQNSFRGNEPVSAQRYFEKQPGLSQLRPDLLKLVHFFHWNVLEPPPDQVKSRYDIIFCRNLFIYFHPAAQVQMIARLKELLNPNGLLFVGHAEAGSLLGPAFRILLPMKAFVHAKQ